MFQVLDLINGIGWSLTYIAAIILGIKNRTWCLPSLAICQNFAWELLVVIDRMQNNAFHSMSFVIQLTWLLLDIGILLTWLCFDSQNGRKYAPKIALFLSVFGLMYILAYRLSHWEIMAFWINAIMSAAFIYRKAVDSSKWTSKLISITKLIGSLAATIGNGLLQRNPFLLWIGGLCFILDLYYVLMLYRKEYSVR